MEDYMSRHKMCERQLALDLEIGDNDTSPEQSQKTDRLHVQLTETQSGSESRCQHILRPDLYFSNNVQFWHERAHTWRALLGMQKGEVKSRGHRLRNAASANIQGEKYLSTT